MEKDIVNGSIGTVGAYDVEFKSGKLVAKVGIEKAAGPLLLKGDIAIELGAEGVIDAIKMAIPGQIDDAVLDLVKAALLK